jgi:hypothetical protein
VHIFVLGIRSRGLGKYFDSFRRFALSQQLIAAVHKGAECFVFLGVLGGAPGCSRVAYCWAG